jgi:HPt (histidine-containing phosphotransfer) domain-containing protein
MMDSNTPQNSLEFILKALRDDYLADLPTRFQEMENQVLALEEKSQFEEQYQALYRNVHSIKGSAGTHGLFILSRVCHRFEDHLSSNKQLRVLSKQEVSHLFKFVDLLVSAREQVISGADAFTSIESDLAALDIKVFKGITKILIVGQSISTIRIITKLLKNYPVQIITLSDGLQSLDKLVHDKFDLMFVGLELPMLNGMALIAAIRMSKSVNSTMPIILLTSKADIKTDPFLSVNYIIQRDSNMILNIEKAFNSIL